jgi:hypothetical protein
MLIQFSNAEDPMVLTLSGILMVPNDVQPLNADTPIDNKLPPSATAGILEQLKKACAPIVWIFPAIVSVLVMLIQFWNASALIEATLGGMLIVPNDVQLLNAPSCIVNKLPPNTIAGIFEQLLNACV